MDIAVKQRILGGVVLVAAAILFLPVVLEGAGVKALQPPAPPTPPSTPTTQDLAPALQAQAEGMAKDISASHGEPTFYPVEPALEEEVAPVQATAEQFRLVDPKAAKPVAAAAPNAQDALAEQQLAANQAAAQAAQLKAQAATEAALQAKRDNAAAEKTRVVDAKAAQIKLAHDKKAAAEKAAAAKLASDKKAAAEKLTAEKAAAAKAAATKAAVAPAPVATADPDPALPQAWVVQVARLNAQSKANALVEKLRARGYRATVTGSGDSWRVIIGPELDKAVAESVKRRLAEDPQLKLNGWIQAYRP